MSTFYAAEAKVIILLQQTLKYLSAKDSSFSVVNIVNLDIFVATLVFCVLTLVLFRFEVLTFNTIE